MEFEEHKSPRLRKYDYASNGAYFVTVCSKEKSKFFCHIVGRAESSRPTGAEGNETQGKRPTVSQIIGALKRFTNKETKLKLWQTSFHDHIIRDERDYLVRWQYIDDNPAKWVDDEYYN